MTFGALALAMTGAPSQASAETLQGSLRDAMTGAPISGSEVVIEETPWRTTTDEQGRWELDLPPGRYTVTFTSRLGEETHRTELVRQHVPQIKPAEARHYTTWFVERGVPVSEHPMGVPTSSGQLPKEAPEAIRLPGGGGGGGVDPLTLTVADPIPRRIRVGRRARPKEGCRDNPVVAIEEMDIDEYVEGVLPPEIGVFQRIPGALETYKAFGVAAKSYGLWFMLTYDEDNRREVDAPLPPEGYTWFHIDDTACNQRYSDERLALTSEAAEAVADQILVKRGEAEVLDKLEYAASCGGHGTLPEYGSVEALVPDEPPVNACAGSWCGHDRCAAHQDNPFVPGDDRCLVRGICQWGAASWGAAGQDYLWILTHYQPNLELRSLQPDEQALEVEVRGYVYLDVQRIEASAVSGVEVTLSDGQRAVTDAQGVFSFERVALIEETLTLTASAPGYVTATRTKPLSPGEVNWASIQIMEERSGSPMEGPEEPLEGMGERASDMGPSEDLGAVAPVVDERDDFDHLVTRSPGLDGGCAQAPQAPPPGGLIVLVMGALGAIGAKRRGR